MVIGIIALLAAMIIPIAANSIESARRTACSNNLRQLGIIFLDYATDHDGWLPLKEAPDYTGGGLSNQAPFSDHVRHLHTNDYLRIPNLLVCPSDKWDGPQDNKPIEVATDLKLANWKNISYMYVSGYSLMGIENHATSPVLADESNDPENGANTPIGLMPNMDEDDNHGADYRNVLYLDGHVRRLKEANLANSIFDELIDSTQVQSVD